MVNIYLEQSLGVTSREGLGRSCKKMRHICFGFLSYGEVLYGLVASFFIFK